MSALLWMMGIFAGALVWGTRRTIQYRQRAARVWRAVGYDLGLDVVVDRSVTHRALEGTLNGATVRAVTRRRMADGPVLGRLMTLRNDSMSVVTHVVAKPAKGPSLPDVSFTAKTLMGELQRRVGGVEGGGFGDPNFDAAVSASGDDLLLCALLSPENRHLLRRLAGRGVEVEFGQLTYEAAGLETDAGELRSLLLEMARAATTLQIEPAHYRARVVSNFAVEAMPEVRERLVRTLLRVAPESNEAIQLVRLALADDNPRVRLAAAPHSSEGADVERSIAGDGALPLAVRQQALAAAVKRGGHGAVRLLDALLARRPDELLWDVLRAVTALEHREASVRLAQMLPRMSSAEDAAFVATTIGEIGDARQESALRDALRAEALVLRRAAANALGQVGTLRAVADLVPLTEGMQDSALKDTARRAIAAIQGREAHGVRAGGLAVVEGGGELAIAEGGRLALADED